MDKKIVEETADFRIYETELVRDSQDKLIRMTLCESLESGRWEPFYSLS